ncbi:MAG: hypothetical protein H7338_24215 [Candidatus Sericytochromatia bacterium]|nr:hypothetical protein [Candidatus Sericytochromatia bacterium]
MGNDGAQIKDYPAALPGAMAVGATDVKDKPRFGHGRINVLRPLKG